MKYRSLIFLSLWVLFLLSTSFTGNFYAMRIATMIAMFSALAFSWNFIGGFAGYPSFSTAAFFGLGSYIGAISQRNGIPMVVAWLLAAFLVAVFSAVLGGILLRLRGHYFAIGSIAVVEVCRLIVTSTPNWTGGGSGLNVPLLRSAPETVALVFLSVMLLVFALTVAVTYAIQESRFGFGLRCIKQNEDAAEMVGIDTTAYKIAAYTLSAVFCGATGAAYASWTGYIDPNESFNLIMSIKVPVMALLGGAGTLTGPALGAAVFMVLEELSWSHFLHWNDAILGGIIVVITFLLPKGLVRFNLRALSKKIGRRVVLQGGQS